MKTKSVTIKLARLILTAGCAIASSAGAVEPLPSPGYQTQSAAEKENALVTPLSLVFADDFSTDPNTNGLWTLHRKVGDLANEAVWDPTAHSWHLTHAVGNLAVAVFANYDLTATEWQVRFRYRVGRSGGQSGGGDGFVFMFYKDKDAYGVPDSGSYMGFEVLDPRRGTIPVVGYGLQFDNFSYHGCDPTLNDYIAIIRDAVCNSALVWREDDRTNDNTWHTVQVTFREGAIKVVIDEETTWNLKLDNPNYTFSGVGFGAGTGAAVEDNEIDDFQLLVGSVYGR
jgi:hypothetical protein